MRSFLVNLMMLSNRLITSERSDLLNPQERRVRSASLTHLSVTVQEPKCDHISSVHVRSPNSVCDLFPNSRKVPVSLIYKPASPSPKSKCGSIDSISLHTLVSITSGNSRSENMSSLKKMLECNPSKAQQKDNNGRTLLHVAVDRDDAPFALITALLNAYPDAARERDYEVSDIHGAVVLSFMFLCSGKSSDCVGCAKTVL